MTRTRSPCWTGVRRGVRARTRTPSTTSRTDPSGFGHWGQDLAVAAFCFAAAAAASCLALAIAARPSGDAAEFPDLVALATSALQFKNSRTVPVTGAKE